MNIFNYDLLYNRESFIDCTTNLSSLYRFSSSSRCLNKFPSMCLYEIGSLESVPISQTNLIIRNRICFWVNKVANEWEEGGFPGRREAQSYSGRAGAKPFSSAWNQSNQRGLDLGSKYRRRLSPGHSKQLLTGSGEVPHSCILIEKFGRQR